ncbi:MAG: hypothetical protein H6R42_864 [Nitrospirae bacterium]|jgi:hypothetical protein|nr:hypothetical protein [Nitrospirota bacterium]
MLDLKGFQFLFQVTYFFPEVLEKKITTLFLEDTNRVFEINELTRQCIEM